MKRILLALTFLFATALARAQLVTIGSITTSTGTVVSATPTTLYSGVLVSIHGTYGSFTANFEVSDDNATTWYSVMCTRQDALATQEISEVVSPDNSSRAWTCPMGGANLFRVRATALASGTVSVRLTQSNQVSAKGSGGGGAVTPASISTATQSYIYATAFGVTANAKFTWNPGFTSGQNTISCTTNNDCNFTSADNGKICFGTNFPATGFLAQMTSTVVLPQGTLTVTGAQTATCSGGNSTATSGVNNSVFVWGTDDTTALGNAFTAAKAACAILMLPGINPTGALGGTTPLQNSGGMMLVQSSLFAVAANASGCVVGVGGFYHGMGVQGGGRNVTMLIPTPNFNASSCTGGGHSACFGPIVDGGSWRDFGIWGAGNSNPGSAFGAVTGIDLTGNNEADIFNVQFMGWGANSTNGIGTGVWVAGFPYVERMLDDGFGIIGVNWASSGSATDLEAIDNQNCNVLVNSGVTLNSYGGLYASNGANKYSVAVRGTFNSFGDDFGNSALSGLTSFGTIGTGIDCSNNTGTGAVTRLYGARIDPGSTTSNPFYGAYTYASNTTYIQNSTIAATSANATGLGGAGTLIDQGGNLNTSTTKIRNDSGLTLQGPGHSVNGACTGTVTAASTLGLYGTGPNETTTTCTSTTIGSGIVMQGPGNLAGMFASATAAGVNASSGVVTVLKNGAGTTITCTIGTGTACFDGTHSVAYVAGDLISLNFTTQTADTLAGVKVVVLY